MACCALNASSVASSSTAEGMNGLELAPDGRSLRVGRVAVIAAATGWQTRSLNSNGFLALPRAPSSFIAIMSQLLSIE